MSVQAPCLAVGQLVGSYRIIRTLGEGAMGEVYEVHDGTLDRRAALKVVPPSMARENGVVARFRREAQAASQVRHAGVVHIFEYGVLPEPVSSPYFIMEYLEGETLHTRLKRAAGRPGGCLGMSCVPVLRQIAIALAAVHRRGFVHRDLKPAKLASVEESDLPFFSRDLAGLREAGKRRGRVGRSCACAIVARPPLRFGRKACPPRRMHRDFSTGNSLQRALA